MKFKQSYSINQNNYLENLDNLYSSLFEASENFYNLTSDGLKQLFDSTFEEVPKVSKATRLIVLNPTNDEDKKKIVEYKRKGFVRTVLFSGTKSRIVKPSIDSTFFKISKEFITEYGLAGLKQTTPEQKILWEKIKSYESKTTKESYFTLNDQEILMFIDMLKQTDPNKYGKGVYYFYDTQNEEFYECIYNKKDKKFDFDRLFKIAKVYEGPNSEEPFKLNPHAQELKDAMVLGCFYDANDLKEKLLNFRDKNQKLEIPYEDKSFRNLIKPFEKALEQSELRRFNEILKRDYKKFGYYDWEGVIDLAAGMSEFIKNVVKVSPYIVFDSISDFKKLESEKFELGSDEDTAKVSRIDLIVSTVPKEILFDNIKNENSIFVEKNGSVEIYINKKLVSKYWQVTFDSKNIGRSQKYFSKLYGMVVKSKEVFESYKEFEELLNENLLDKLTSIGKIGSETLKEIGKKFYDKIKYIVLAFKNWSENFKKKLINNVSKNVGNDCVELYGLGLKESVKQEINELIQELLKDPKSHYENGNRKINNLLRMLEKGKNHEIIKVKFEEAGYPKVINSNTFMKQIFNYSFLKTFKNSIMDADKEMINYVDELLGLYIEAAYGSTKLPIWKVYGGFDVAPYEYMGTKEKEKETRKESIIKNLEKELPLVFLNVYEVNGNKGYHNIEMSTISNMISENGKFEPRYTKFEVDYDKNSLAPSFVGTVEEKIENS